MDTLFVSSLKKTMRDTPGIMRRALDYLSDNFNLQLPIPEKMLLLHEVRKAQEIQRRTLELDPTGVGCISIHREAVMNYLERWYGLGSTADEQQRICLAFPDKSMFDKIRQQNGRYET